MSDNSTFVLTHHQQVLQYFHYNASTTGADIWIALFGFVTVVGFLISLRFPKAWFMQIFVFSAALECAGYGTRLESIWHPKLAPFVTSVLFILLAPIFLALVNYIVVGKLIEPTGKKIGWINPTSISKVFFASDFAGLIVQGLGGSILASAKTETQFDAGSNIILAGLAIQVGFFTIFTYMMLVSAFGKDFNMYARDDLKTSYNVLFVTTILIYVRNIFRLIEYAVPHASYIPTHEWLFFVFESAPIFLVCCIYCIWHFGFILPDDVLTHSIGHDGSSKGGKSVAPGYNNVNSEDGVELGVTSGGSPENV